MKANLYFCSSMSIDFEEKLILEEIEQLKQSQTNILTFGAGIVGLLLAAIIQLNSSLYINSNNNTIFIVFNYLVLAGVFPFFSKFLSILHSKKGEDIEQLLELLKYNSNFRVYGVIDTSLLFTLDKLIKSSHQQHTLVKSFLSNWFIILDFVCLSIYDFFIINNTEGGIYMNNNCNGFLFRFFLLLCIYIFYQILGNNLEKISILINLIAILFVGLSFVTIGFLICKFIYLSAIYQSNIIYFLAEAKSELTKCNLV